MNPPAVELKRLERLRRLLNPASVAVAGGEVAAEVIRQCRAIGYGGELWAINPHRARIEGVQSFPNVDALALHLCTACACPSPSTAPTAATLPAPPALSEREAEALLLDELRSLEQEMRV